MSRAEDIGRGAQWGRALADLRTALEALGRVPVTQLPTALRKDARAAIDIVASVEQRAWEAYLGEHRAASKRPTRPPRRKEGR